MVIKKENIDINNSNEFVLKYKISKISTSIFLAFLLIDVLLGLFLNFNFTIGIGVIIEIILNYFIKMKEIKFTIDYLTFIEIIYSMIFLIIVLCNKKLDLYFKKLNFDFLKNKKTIFIFIIIFLLNFLTKILKKYFCNNFFMNSTISYNISSLLLAPFLEETIFKGILFNLFYKINKNIKIFFLSLLFSIIHIIGPYSKINFFELLTILIFTFFTFLYSYITFKIYIKKNNLLILYIIHFIVNFIIICYNYIFNFWFFWLKFKVNG